MALLVLNNKLNKSNYGREKDESGEGLHKEK